MKVLAVVILSLSFAGIGVQCKKRKNGPSSGDGAPSKEDLYKINKSTINFKAEKFVTGLEYLGCGYDVVKAHTMGDFGVAEDVGYRAQIVDFVWAKTDVGVTNSLEWLQPIGAWVRPKVSCGETEIVSEHESTSFFRSVAEADVKIAARVPNLGSANIGTEVKEEIKRDQGEENKVYQNTYYCFTYAAGMPMSFYWFVYLHSCDWRRRTKREFQVAVKRLSPDQDSFDNCTIAKFRQKAEDCTELLEWVDFFTEFGTHVIKEIHLGGKLTRFLKAPKSAVEALSEKGVNVDVAASAVLSGGVEGALKLDVNTGEKSAIKKFNESSKLEFSVLGGIHTSKTISPDSLLKWKASIPKYPMPIKWDIIGMDRFLPSNLHKAYKEALQMYIKINRASPWQTQEDVGNIYDARTLFTDAIQVVNTSDSVKKTYPKCPNDTHVLLGFLMVTNKESKTLTLQFCPQHSKTCDTPTKPAPEDTYWIWMLCGHSKGVEITQHVINDDQGEARSASCKDKRAILAGLVVTKHKDEEFMTNLEACQMGESQCHETIDNKATHAWIACVDKEFPGLKEVGATAAIGFEKYTQVAKGKPIMTGFRGCYGATHSFDVCKRYFKGCKQPNKTDKHKCLKTFVWTTYLNNN